ncbi:MAG TPA: hypothetical protein VF171_03865 [Trueperaceae bacterium]
MTRHKEQLPRAPQRTEGKVEGDRFTVSEAERLLGLSPGALNKWLRRHKLLRKCPKVGKYRYVNVGLLEHYEAGTHREGVTRANHRPAGWVGIYKAEELAGCHRSVIYRAVRKHRVRAARVGYINYYCPQDLERLRLEMHHYPLPGWEQVNTFADRHKADRSGVVAWLKRHGWSVRKLRRPTDNQTCFYAPHTALKLWEAHYRERRD